MLLRAAAFSEGIAARNALFFLTAFGAIVVMILLFSWFPVNDWTAWAGFLISFCVSMGISVLLSRLKERAENRRMQAALEQYTRGGPGKRD